MGHGGVGGGLSGDKGIRDREQSPAGTRRGPGHAQAGQGGAQECAQRRCHLPCPRSIPGSAVCAFYLAELEKAFEGSFAEPRGATWAPVPEDRVPRPRPGCCAGLGPAAGIATSGDFPDETLAFAKEHPLLHGAVPPAGGHPLFTRTGPRLTQLAVDVGAGPWGNQTVLFLGTEDGRLLKVLVGTWHPGAAQHPTGTPAPPDSQEQGAKGDASSETLLLEEISLYEPGRCQGQQGASRVLGLELHLPGQELFVAFSGCLLRLPLSRCAQHGACRGSCLATRDPYCVWLPPRGCVPFSRDLPSGFEQDLEGSSGSAGTCQGAAGDSDGDLAHGVRQPGPGAAALVPVPVLAGCMLGAFASGALAAALLSACCRRPPPPPKTPPEPPTTATASATAAAAAPPTPAQPPAPRLYPLLPPRDPLPELPTPEPTPQPPAKAPRERLAEPRRGRAPPPGTPSCPEPPGPGPPPKATLEERQQRGYGPGGSAWAGACGRSATPPGGGSFANRVRPGGLSASLPPGPRDAAPRRLDVPPDSPPPPRRPLAQRHSLGGTPARPPGLPRGLTRMHSLGTAGGTAAGTAWALERSCSAKPPLLPKPSLLPAAPGRP
ncbi:LOW QUALITY PROTEIN: semaphorin-6C [Pogoniulus pusillus]|uniref:LOW QUALITY PROTEIN: semaphorin-6C n=1 Tax=Pogoniulus pusillus TaxID=488313 RepID=UPI0030B9319E